MISSVFKLNPTDSSTCQVIDKDGIFVYKFTIPVLSAYAVEYVTFHLSGRTAFLGYSTVRDNILEIHCRTRLEEYECTAVVHFHGIRDYSLLFPNVQPDQLRERLGQFYKEAESNFHNASWLSFMLMCGAIFEGILYSKLNINEPFNKLISKACSGGIIDSESGKIMEKVRSYRNLVHANKHDKSYVPRADAMDTRCLLDQIVKSG